MCFCRSNTHTYVKNDLHHLMTLITYLSMYLCAACVPTDVKMAAFPAYVVAGILM